MPTKVTPTKHELEQYLSKGLTHQEIADAHEQRTGVRVARSSISAAIHRYGLSEAKARYIEEIPWRLKGKDLKAYPVRMLRLLGKRRAGEDLTPGENARLNAWLDTMHRNDAVVAWDPEAEPSVMYVKRQEGDPVDIPIRRRRVFLRPPGYLDD